MALGVHALLEGEVVALLQRLARCIARVRADGGAAEEADAGANRCTLPAADQAAGSRADGGADHGALRRGFGSRVIGGLAADRGAGIVAAIGVVDLELVPGLGAA